MGVERQLSVARVSHVADFAFCVPSPTTQELTMFDQLLESFLGSDHGRAASDTLQQQGVPQGRIQQMLSEALQAHQGNNPQAAGAGVVTPFIQRFMQEHLGGRAQATTPQGQAKLDANLGQKGGIGKGIGKGTTPEGEAKLEANRNAKGGGAEPFGKQGFGKGLPQK